MYAKTNLDLGLQTFLRGRSVSGSSSGPAMCLVSSTSCLAFFSFQCCQQQAAVLESPVRSAQSTEYRPNLSLRVKILSVTPTKFTNFWYNLGSFRIRKVVDEYTSCIPAIGATYPSWATSNMIFTTKFFFLFPNSDPDGAIASC